MYWMLLPLKRYADFSGRSRRLEYWMFSLFTLLLLIGFYGLAVATGSVAEDDVPTGPALAIFAILSLGLIIPSLAVQVRRLHDQNLSGWWTLLNLIPYLGSLILLVPMLRGGTKGPNRFGPDPKQSGADLLAT